MAIKKNCDYTDPMLRFVLASQSPRRSFFLRERGYVFHTFPVEISEFLDKNLRVEEAVEKIAWDKAKALVESKTLPLDQNHLILAADTLVFLKGCALGKPQDQEDAFAILESLSGETHQVITAFCLWNTLEGRSVTGHCTSDVKFRTLTKEEILAYIATGDPMDKAGAYGIQSLGRDFVEHFTGTLENIAGLPIDEIEKVMAKEGWVVK
jgi:septum formation protein